MGKLVLVTGGVRSGKSGFAQKLAGENRNVGMIATAVVTDDEMKARVEKHRADRPSSWTTYEKESDMQTVFEKTSHEAYLVDCMTVYLTNFLYTAGCFEPDTVYEDISRAEEAYGRHIEKVVGAARENGADVIFVTNETGCGIVPETLQMRCFRDIAGRSNQLLASMCDEVYISVCGIPLRLK